MIGLHNDETRLYAHATPGTGHLNQAAGCTVTIAAHPNHHWVIDDIYYSANEAINTVVLISVNFGGAALAQFRAYWDCATADFCHITFPKGLSRGVLNEACVVLVSDPAGTATAELNVLYH